MNVGKSAMLRWWRHAVVTCVIAGCSGDSSVEPPDGAQLAGALRGTWQVATSNMTSANPNVSCRLTGTLRLYERSARSGGHPELFPPVGVFGYFVGGVMNCAGIVDAKPLGAEVREFSANGSQIVFKLRPLAESGAPFAGSCSGIVSGETISGNCAFEYTSAGISQWQGMFTATRVSSSPEP